MLHNTGGGWRLVRVMEKPQVNIFGTDARERVEARLRGWYKLTLDVERLKREITESTVELQTLDGRIASSIVQKYEGMDMPRGSGVNDRTGNLATSIAMERGELALELIDKQLQLSRAQRRLKDIETAVGQLNPRDAEIVKMFYLQKARWESITVRLKIGKTRLYEIIDNAKDAMGDLL